MKMKKPKMKKPKDSLVGRFKEAGLELEMLDKPIGRVFNQQMLDIFAMDIQRRFHGVARSEYFRIYRGSDTNRIEVVSIDKSIAQLVLMVHESRREFIEEVPMGNLRQRQRRDGDDWLPKLMKEERLTSKDLVAAGPNRVAIRRFTPDRKRHYLCGVDERQLFIAQLPRGVATVRDAHASLKTSTVTLAEGRVDGRTVRQGEWFFLNVSEAKRKEINEGIRKCRIAVQRNATISTDIDGRAPGKPHVAEELVRLQGELLQHGFSVRRRPEIFVRGKVRHPDHDPISFGEWRMVLLNNETREAGGGGAGVRWID